MELPLKLPFLLGRRLSWPCNPTRFAVAKKCLLTSLIINSTTSLASWPKATTGLTITRSITSNKSTSTYLNKFVNHLMIDGKKGVAIALFADSLQFFLKRLQEGRASTSTPSRPLSRGQGPIGRGNHQASFLTGGIHQASLMERSLKKNKKRTEQEVDKAPQPLVRRVTKDLLCRMPIPSPDPSKAMGCVPATRYSPPQDPSLAMGLAVGKGTVSSKKKGEDKTLLVKKNSFPPFTGSFLLAMATSSLSLANCLECALGNVEPSLEIRKKKIAGATRQIPSIVTKSRSRGLAIRWIIVSARERRRKEGKRFSECLAEELVSAYYKKGEPRQKRDSLHKLAESNRAFLRYRWW